MKPEDIGYLTELDKDFVKDLKSVHDENSFQSFLDKWNYWLDPETQKLKGSDWGWMSPLLDDTRSDDVIPEDKHDSALRLVMPEKIVKVTVMAHRFKTPWGCAYIRMKEEEKI
jgi:hypothetical protein